MPALLVFYALDVIRSECEECIVLSLISTN